jgi:hypothetical protein
MLLAGLALLAAGPRSDAGDDFKLEPGFTLLFNGKDLTGWKAKKGSESLDGKTEAYGKRFVVADGILTIDPSVKGDVRIETAKHFDKDVHIKFEFKPGPKCNNDLFIRGNKFDITQKGVKNAKDGEWNTFEIIITGDKSEFKCNGQTERTAGAKGSTPFEIRAEFGTIQFRRMRYKE